MVAIIMSPFTSEAWFFATAQAQNDGDEPAASPYKNTQNLELLVSAVGMTSDLKPNSGLDEVVIVDGQALDPEIGSSGTVVDIIGAPEDFITTSYIVQPGDTVARVAQRFGISENTLRFANGMKKTDVLHRGDTLLILPVNGIRYTVTKGDTLSSIAKKYKLEPQDITEMLDYNNLESGSALKIGEIIIIPGAELVVPAAPSSSKTPSSKTSIKTSTKAKTASSSTTSVTRGYFIKPVPCPLSQGKHDNYAIDMACGRSGIPIKAAAEGKVIRAQYGWNGGYGNLVVLQHPNGMVTFYAHMLAASMKVSLGDSVEQGQVIGLIGSTGRSTGPHLHFEVRNGVNPGFDKTGSAWKPQ